MQAVSVWMASDLFYVTFHSHCTEKKATVRKRLIGTQSAFTFFANDLDVPHVMTSAANLERSCLLLQMPTLWQAGIKPIIFPVV